VNVSICLQFDFSDYPYLFPYKYKNIIDRYCLNHNVINLLRGTFFILSDYLTLIEQKGNIAVRRMVGTKIVQTA